MKTKFVLIVLCVAGFFFSCSDRELIDQSDVDLRFTTTRATGSGVTVQWDQVQQNIDGFGICQGHADDLYAHHKRAEIMSWLYGTQGLRLNILRGELSTHFSPSAGVYDFGFDRDIDISFDDPLFEALSNSDNPDAVELYLRAQHWVLREAKQIHNVEKIMFSAWSPPSYMKSNNSDVKGYLKLSKYQDYADYIVRFLKEFQTNGYPIYAVSPANEPEYAADWTSCLWLPGSTTLGPFIVNNLGPAILQEGLNTNIIFGENAQWTGILGFILGSKSYVTNIINLNSRITNFNVIAAGHGYVDPVTGNRPAIEPFDKALQKGIPVWMTEASSTDYSNVRNDIEDGLNWAADWHRYLSDASVSALIYWLGAVPGVNDEGLIYMDMGNREDYTLTKRYETFGNFSRYIQPNSQRITIDRGNGLPADFHISSYKNGNEMVIVTVNKTDENVLTPLNVTDVQGVSDLKRILTDTDNRWAETTVLFENGQYMLDIPAKSVVTFVGTIL